MKLFTLIDVSSSGTLGSLHVKSLKWTNITSENLEKLDFIPEIINLLKLFMKGKSLKDSQLTDPSLKRSQRSRLTSFNKEREQD